MEEIDLKELFNFFKGKIGFIITITAAVCILGSVYGFLIQKPMYQSYTTVILGSSTTTSNGITQNDVTLNKNLVSTYAEIVKSKRVLNQVIKELELDTSYESLVNEISVSSVNETEIIKITVSDRDAVKAKNIANVTANSFAKEVIDLYKMNNVSILDEATVATSPYNINVVKQLIIYVMVGLVLGCGISFVIFYFDRTIKSVEQVEQKIKLPILGSVQMYGKGGRK